MIRTQVREKIAGEPLLALFRPVATGAPALGRGGFGGKLRTQCGGAVTDGFMAWWVSPELRASIPAMLCYATSVDFHRQSTTVGVPHPPTDRRDVDAGLDTPGREQVPGVVMGNAANAERRARRVD